MMMMMMMMSPPGVSLAKAPDECQICYEAFDGRARRPQRLPCQHRVCARCLRGMAAAAAAAEAPVGSLRCPFCRHQAPMPGQDDGAAAAAAAAALLGRRLPGPSEVLLCPGAIPESLATASPSDCLVVTLLEVPGGEEAASGSLASGGGLLELLRLYRRASLASVRCSSPPGKRWPRPSGGGGGGGRRSFPRVLLALLALLSFISLPLGLYLLLVGRLGPGAVLASLVPSGLLLGLAASLCRCLWRDDARRPPSRAAAGAAAAAARRTPPARPQLPARPPSASAAAAAAFAEPPLPGAGGGGPGESRDPLEPPPDSAPA